LRSRGAGPLVFLLALGLAAAAHGDEPPPAPSTRPATSPPPAASEAANADQIVEIKPELFYLRDKDGRLVPVPGFSYDDFVKYYRLKEQIDKPEIKPRFSLEQLTIAAAVDSRRPDRADLTVTIKVLLLDSDWTRIPLKLNKDALSEPANYKGNGDQLLQFDPSGDGYVCWLRGATHSEHELVLKLTAPLSTIADESRLELTLPRSAASKLILHVPAADLVASVSTGISRPDVAVDGKGSLISVLGVGGDCWIAWRAADQPPIRLSSALEAVGVVWVKIYGRSATSEAALTVRSFGAEFDHFRVRLPPGAQLTAGAEPGYTLSPVGKPDAAMVDVKLERKTVGPVDVRIVTERAYDVTKRGEILDLAGFSVAEAIPHRQWGHVAVTVSGDWQLVWGELSRARQVDELPEALRRRDVTAAFEYFGQPASLPVRVVARKTRVSVDPQYTYRVGAERTQLEARLKYTVRGSRVFKFDVDLPGWDVDSIGPEERIDGNSIVSAPAGAITVPLVQPATGDFELNIKAHRANALDKNVVEWTLPEPHADVHEPADVVIVPAENVDLSPLNDKLVGLNPGTGNVLPPNLPTRAITYRAEQTRARFRAEMTVHQQAVSVECNSRISIQPHAIDVSQLFDFRVRYEPLDRITLDVPRTLLDDPKLQFMVAGEPVEPREVGEPPALDRRTVELPVKPTTGSFRVEARSHRPQPILVDSATTAVAVPLIVPVGARLTTNEAAVVADPGIRIEQREGPWSVLDSPRAIGGAPNSIGFAAAEAAPELRLAVGLDQQKSTRTPNIDRAWIQTWVTENVRQDRAIYKLTSDEDQVRVKLPEGISGGDVEVKVDGHSVKPNTTTAGMLDIPLQSGPSRHDHLLELRYQFDAPGMQNGWLSFTVPAFDRSVRIQRTYWQLVLPVDVMLLGGSSDMTAEFDWQWNHRGVGWERVAFKEQPELERWIGFRTGNAVAQSATTPSPAVDEVPERTNRYLYSVVGPTPSFEVAVARRWLVVLLASLTSLLAALALLYVPALRQPRLLLVGACLLLLLIVAWPDQSILIAETAVLGLGLALLAVILQRIVTDRSQMPAARLDGSTHERSSRRIRPASADDMDLVTSTASIGIAIGESDGERRDDRQSDSQRRRGGSTSGTTAEA
jgi:hypothetical protein